MRWNGLIFEACMAAIERRTRCDLYHSALAVSSPSGRFVIELAPASAAVKAAHGTAVEGPVGTRWAGRFRAFRYEVRCWRDGQIPDLAEAVGGPQTLSTDENAATRIIELVAHVPALVWGRDESSTGEMWNSNSVTSGCSNGPALT